MNNLFSSPDLVTDLIKKEISFSGLSDLIERECHMTCLLRLAVFLIDSRFEPEDGGSTLLRNADGHISDYRVLYPRFCLSHLLNSFLLVYPLTMKNEAVCSSEELFQIFILSRVRRLYTTGIGLTTGFIGLQLQLHLITVYTLYNSLCSL
jgi:hypothetical protein